MNIVDDTFGGGYTWRVVIDDNRMRRDSPATKKKSANLRVLAIGDSGTFGWGVDQQDAYPQVLEWMLRATYHDGSIEVLNCGIPAHTIIQERYFYETRWSQWEHDIVLIGVFENDLRDITDFNGARARAIEVKRKYSWFFTLNRYLGRFAIFNGCKRIATQLLRDYVLGGNGTPEVLAGTGKADQDSVSTDEKHDSQSEDEANGVDEIATVLAAENWQVYRRELIKLDQQVKINGAKLILLYIPSFEDLLMRRSALPLLDPLRALCEELNVPLIDPRNSFPIPSGPMDDRITLRNFGDKGHYNASGHRYLAAGIMDDRPFIEYVSACLGR